ncbi:hypothetical protein HYFRA_00003746 [Hymenoscyphus fraxineus]|uniref:Aromatic prenyltransferase n=1 Tax=Hymenoscyphus fraxineus TaxID=746836 RepID=A0A9N9KZJ6_9HELO|nr:hypothetical protein HYFRA_00003746 [Hymenoscyphus fraxineus]
MAEVYERLLCENRSTGSSTAKSEKKKASLSPTYPSSREQNLVSKTKTSSAAWKVLTNVLQITDGTAKFWWQKTGIPLSILVEKAGYNIHSQYAALLFHFQHIVYHLGPSPTQSSVPERWTSFATDDHSPIEYSWTWTSPPRVQYGVEAIGLFAGSPEDLYNRLETDILVKELQPTTPHLDWQLYDHFRKEMHAKSDVLNTSPPSTSAQTSLGLAFELWDGNVFAKAYFAPVEEEYVGCTKLEIATMAIHKLHKLGLQMPAYDQFLQFMEGSSDLSFVCLAVDCVDPRDSRFKLYIRGGRTSFDDVCTTLKANLAENPLWTEDLLSQLKELWYLLLGLDKDFPTSSELPRVDHQTAGILYNVDIHKSKNVLETSIYIPVRHYAGNDLEIAKGLGEFLYKQGNGQYVESYIQMLTEMCSYRPLEDGCGVQTYISCKAKKGGLFLTSYLSPEIYMQE